MKLTVAVLAMCVVLAGCSPSSEPPTANPALKPIDAAALQAVVEKAAKDLYVPGAMVVLRTPQGDFATSYGTTELGAQTPPAGDTHFRIASNTKTFTSA